MNYTKSNYKPTPNVLNGMFENLFQNGFQRILHDDCANPSPVNILETATSFEMSVSIPGHKKEDLKLSIEQNTMKIAFEAQPSQEEQINGKWLRKEFKKGAFSRSFTLNEQINKEEINANYTNGILHISLPKKEKNTPAQQEITIS